MQLFGALCLFFCVTAMLCHVFGHAYEAVVIFVIALILMAASLIGLIVEIWISGGAMRIMLGALEKSLQEEEQKSEE